MNIDWPPKQGMKAAALEESIATIVDEARAVGLNAIALQARPAADALYRSQREPPSSYISGTQGLAPDETYDALSRWIELAHARGLRLYAWVNPFRAGAPTIGAYASASIRSAHPEWVMDLGPPGYAWIDPGIPEARAYVIESILEIARDYDIDGIVLDDYFYPTKEQRPRIDELPDAAARAFATSPEGHSIESRRLESSAAFLLELRAALRAERPDLPLGLSPAGVWRPGFPEGIKGRDSLREAWIDSKAALEAGLVDFFSPQLYWPISQAPQSFPLLFRFWQDATHNDTFIWPSIRVAPPLAASANQDPSVADEARIRESIGQILVERGMERGAGGFMLYSWTGISKTEKGSLSRALGALLSPMPATVPDFSWLEAEKPGPPVSVARISFSQGNAILGWSGEKAREIVLRTRDRSGAWKARILPWMDFTAALQADEIASKEIWLSAIDLRGREGPAVQVDASGR